MRRSSARDLELAAFAEVGRRDVGMKTWEDASAAAAHAWRECRAQLRSTYGARNPHWGWSSLTLMAAALCAAVAAVLTSGFRFDPDETIVPVVVLVVIAGLLDLAVVGATRARPVSAGFLRPQLVVAIGLVLAAVLQVSRGVTPLTPVLVAAAVIGAGGYVLFLVVRAARPADREQIDTAINRAVAGMQPEVDAVAATIQARAIAGLTPQEHERIVSLRTTWLGDPATADAPAGAMIISSFLSTWSPYLQKG